MGTGCFGVVGLLLVEVFPPGQSDSLFLENLSNNLSTYLKDYDSILRLGDFNVTTENKKLQHFTNSFNLDKLMHKATCLKDFSVA